MVYYLLLCRSITYAQQAARALERAGITAIVTRAPRKIASEGCAYCVKLSGKRLADALSAVRNAGITGVRVFAQYADGNLSEVGG
jgi:rhodanese-related sulfurtransferase